MTKLNDKHYDSILHEKNKFLEDDANFKLNESYASYAETDPPSKRDIYLDTHCHNCGERFFYFRYFFKGKLFCKRCYEIINGNLTSIDKIEKEKENKKEIK